MEGKSNSHMGDVIVSPSPSPLQQQNFADEPVEIAGKAVKLPSIAVEDATDHDGLENPEESEGEDEDQQEQAPDNLKRKAFRKRKKPQYGNYLPPHKFRRMTSAQSRRHGSFSGGGINKASLKFLLGGNAHDPLNLNGLGDSDNAVTPKTSPMPAQVQNTAEIPIWIPKNYKDPLLLMADEDVENTRDVIEGVVSDHPHKRKRHRRRSIRKRNESECSGDFESGGGTSETTAEAAVDVKVHKVEEPQEGEEVEKFKVTASAVEETQDAGTMEIKEGVVEKEKSEPTVVNENEKKRPVAATESEAEPSPYRGSSDYVPLSSHYQPSPFVMDTMNENFTVLPFESPHLTHYMGPEDYRGLTITEPFSPPPRTNHDVIEHRVPSGHYNLGWTPPRNHVQRREVPKPPTVTQQAMFNRRHRNRLDPIVSPVFPNFVAKRSWGGAPHTYHHHGHPRHGKKQEPSSSKPEETAKPSSSKKYRPKDKIFQYGNYNQYYGYRNSKFEEDTRLRAFKKEWIEGKDVLDIGCNIGHVTLCVGRDFCPRRIVGIDIDSYLIKVANKNIKHYVDRDPVDVSIKFPLSLSIVHGSLQPPQLHPPKVEQTPEHGVSPNPGSGTQEAKNRIPFPYNVGFRHENYVLDGDELLSSVKPQYDVILCLSTTKWVHLNFGDDGLKRFFRRVFLNLRAEGLFILEPQPWSSYKKKKKLTEQIFSTFQSIKFFPKDFESYLLRDVGFTSVIHQGVPAHHSKGFQRPIYVFKKGTAKPSSTLTSAPNEVGEIRELQVPVDHPSAHDEQADQTTVISSEETN